MTLFQPPSRDPDAEALRRISSFKKRTRPVATLLGAEALHVFQQQVVRQQGKFGKLSDAWREHVPEPMLPHCTLSSFVRGTLTVLVDSSSHLFELKQMMLAGLEKQLLFTARGAGLRKITLKLGA
jgi:hypothetical protein